ncbi:MAG: FMN-binding protein [Chloroflexi bacterium]|nr:FMN-binding protein [Chloroflexota bacterium]
MSSIIRMIKKFFVSAFVVVTFVAYVLHERVVNPEGSLSVTTPMPIAAITQPIQVAPTATSTSAPAFATEETNLRPTPTATPAQLVLVATPTPQILPTSTALPTSTPEINGQYKDGTYTGVEANALYGWVQVAAVVQNGQLTDVQFLQYPQDRRTSVRINSRAVPNLQSEAIQAQSANVDIVSGATLTSRAFIQSLQSALDTAKA